MLTLLNISAMTVAVVDDKSKKWELSKTKNEQAKKLCTPSQRWSLYNVPAVGVGVVVFAQCPPSQRWSLYKDRDTKSLVG